MKSKAAKTRMKMFAIIALIAVVAVGSTLAYLSTTTETKTNTFSSTNDIKGRIEETQWDTEHPDGWTDYTPGDVTAKDPKVTLEDGSEPSWVGMKLSFKDAVGATIPYESFQGYASYDQINPAWTLVAKNGLGEELYVNNNVVDGNNSSETIFNNITVNAGVTTVGSSVTKDFFKRVIEYDANGAIVSNVLTKVDSTTDTNVAYYDQDGHAVGAASTLPKFEIDAQGFAVQQANVDNAQAVTEIIKLANVGVEENSNSYFHAV